MRKIIGEELFKCVHNALRKEIDFKGRVRFFRFTEKQLIAYKKDKIFEERAVLHSGVKLDFFTDSQYFGLSWELIKKGPWNDESVADLYVDGVLVKSYHFSEFSDKKVTILEKLKKGKKRIEFWFSKAFEIALSEMFVSKDATITHIKKKRNYIAFGDSITFSSALHPSLGYAMQIAEHFGWELYNQGVGGYYFNEESLDEEIPIVPDVITVAYGTNDDRSNRDLYRKRVYDYLQRLTSIWNNVPIFVITPLWRLDLKESEDFIWVYDVIENECKKFPQISVIDGRNMMPRTKDFYSDGFLHPNDCGMTLYAKNVINIMQKLQILI